MPAGNCSGLPVQVNLFILFTFFFVLLVYAMEWALGFVTFRSLRVLQHLFFVF